MVSWSKHRLRLKAHGSSQEREILVVRMLLWEVGVSRARLIAEFELGPIRASEWLCDFSEACPTWASQKGDNMFRRQSFAVSSIRSGCDTARLARWLAQGVSVACRVRSCLAASAESPLNLGLPQSLRPCWVAWRGSSWL